MEINRIDFKFRAEYGATAATAQHNTRGSYSDVLKCGLNPHHFK